MLGLYMGLWDLSVSRRVFAEKIRGGAMRLERHLVAYGNKRERKDSLKISGTICRQK